MAVFEDIATLSNVNNVTRANIIKPLMNEKFYCDTFANYCEDRANNYTQFYNCFAEVLNLINTEDDANPQVGLPLLTADEENQIMNILNLHNINPDGWVTLSQGSITFKSLFSQVFRINKAYVNQNYRPNDDKAFTLADELIPLRKSNDSITYISYYDLIDDVKTTYHSMICLSSALLAAKTSNKTSERLVVYRDRISRVFENAFSDYSSMSEYYVNILQNNDTQSSVTNAIIIAMDAEEVVNNTIDIDNTNLYQYTGANPLSGVATAEAFSLVGQVIKTAVTVVAKICQTVVSAIGAVFSWVGNLFKGLTNPYDIECIDEESDSYLVDGFSFQIDNRSTETGVGFYKYIGIINLVPIDIQTKTMDALLNKWYKVSTLGGEYMFKLEPFTNSQGESYRDFDGYRDWYVNLIGKYKPRSVSKEVMAALNEFIYSAPGEHMNLCLYAEKSDGSKYTFKELGQAISQRFATINTFYLGTDVSENEMYDGFCDGILLDELIAEIYSNISDYSNPDDIVYNNSESASYAETIRLFLQDQFPYIEDFRLQDIYKSTSAITNADFVNIVSGALSIKDVVDGKDITVEVNMDKSNKYYYFFGKINPTSIIHQCVDVVGSTLLCKNLYPLDYEFFPYLGDVDSFSSPSFKIKTDEENQQAVTNFLSTLVLITIAVTVAVTAIVLIKKIRRSILLHRVKTETILRAKLSNGQPLSSREKYSLARATRKLNSLSATASGMLSSNFTYSINSNDELMEDLLQLIK